MATDPDAVGGDEGSAFNVLGRIEVDLNALSRSLAQSENEVQQSAERMRQANRGAAITPSVDIPGTKAALAKLEAEVLQSQQRVQKAVAQIAGTTVERQRQAGVPAAVGGFDPLAQRAALAKVEAEILAFTTRSRAALQSAARIPGADPADLGALRDTLAKAESEVRASVARIRSAWATVSRTAAAEPPTSRPAPTPDLAGRQAPPPEGLGLKIPAGIVPEAVQQARPPVPKTPVTEAAEAVRTARFDDAQLRDITRRLQEGAGGIGTALREGFKIGENQIKSAAADVAAKATGAPRAGVLGPVPSTTAGAAGMAARAAVPVAAAEATVVAKTLADTIRDAVKSARVTALGAMGEVAGEAGPGIADQVKAANAFAESAKTVRKGAKEAASAIGGLDEPMMPLLKHLTASGEEMEHFGIRTHTAGSEMSHWLHIGERMVAGPLSAISPAAAQVAGAMGSAGRQARFFGLGMGLAIAAGVALSVAISKVIEHATKLSDVRFELGQSLKYLDFERASAAYKKASDEVQKYNHLLKEMEALHSPKTMWEFVSALIAAGKVAVTNAEQLKATEAEARANLSKVFFAKEEPKARLDIQKTEADLNLRIAESAVERASGVDAVKKAYEGLAAAQARKIGLDKDEIELLEGFKIQEARLAEIPSATQLRERIAQQEAALAAAEQDTGTVAKNKATADLKARFRKEFEEALIASSGVDREAFRKTEVKPPEVVEEPAGKERAALAASLALLDQRGEAEKHVFGLRGIIRDRLGIKDAELDKILGDIAIKQRERLAELAAAEEDSVQKRIAAAKTVVEARTQTARQEFEAAAKAAADARRFAGEVQAPGALREEHALRLKLDMAPIDAELDTRIREFASKQRQIQERLVGALGPARDALLREQKDIEGQYTADVLANAEKRKQVVVAGIAAEVEAERARVEESVKLDDRRFQHRVKLGGASLDEEASREKAAAIDSRRSWDDRAAAAERAYTVANEAAERSFNLQKQLGLTTLDGEIAAQSRLAASAVQGSRAWYDAVGKVVEAYKAVKSAAKSAFDTIVNLGVEGLKGRKTASLKELEEAAAKQEQKQRDVIAAAGRGERVNIDLLKKAVAQQDEIEAARKQPGGLASKLTTATRSVEGQGEVAGGTGGTEAAPEPERGPDILGRAQAAYDAFSQKTKDALASVSATWRTAFDGIENTVTAAMARIEAGVAKTTAALAPKAAPPQETAPQPPPAARAAPIAPPAALSAPERMTGAQIDAEIARQQAAAREQAGPGARTDAELEERWKLLTRPAGVPPPAPVEPFRPAAHIPPPNLPVAPKPPKPARPVGLGFPTLEELPGRKPTVLAAPTFEVPVPKPVEVPQPEVRGPKPVEVPSGTVSVTAPKVEVHTPGAIEIPAPEVRQAPAVVPPPLAITAPPPEIVAPAAKEVPAPEVRGAARVTVSGDMVEVKAPEVRLPAPVAVAAPEVRGLETINVPGGTITINAPKVVAPAPVQIPPAEVRTPAAVEVPAPRVAVAAPVVPGLTITPPVPAVQAQEPVRIPAPTVQVQPVAVPPSEAITPAAPAVRSQPVAYIPAPRVVSTPAVAPPAEAIVPAAPTIQTPPPVQIPAPVAVPPDLGGMRRAVAEAARAVEAMRPVYGGAEEEMFHPQAFGPAMDLGRSREEAERGLEGIRREYTGYTPPSIKTEAPKAEPVDSAASERSWRDAIDRMNAVSRELKAPVVPEMSVGAGLGMAGTADEQARGVGRVPSRLEISAQRRGAREPVETSAGASIDRAAASYDGFDQKTRAVMSSVSEVWRGAFGGVEQSFNESMDRMEARMAQFGGAAGMSAADYSSKTGQVMEREARRGAAV